VLVPRRYPGPGGAGSATIANGGAAPAPRRSREPRGNFAGECMARSTIAARRTPSRRHDAFNRPWSNRLAMTTRG
jgi:hypothetical protein